MATQDVPGRREEREEPYLEGLNPIGADGAAPAARDGIGPATNPPGAPAPAQRPGGSGRIWAVAVLTALVLFALIVFIAQNTARAEISFFGFSGSLPLASALLAAALAGAAVTAAIGGARSALRRRAARRGR